MLVEAPLPVDEDVVDDAVDLRRGAGGQRGVGGEGLGGEGRQEALGPHTFALQAVEGRRVGARGVVVAEAVHGDDDDGALLLANAEVLRRALGRAATEEEQRDEEEDEVA